MTIEEISTALSHDLDKARPNAFATLAYDSARKLFKTRKENAVFEFDYRQKESDFWVGTKTYGSGVKSKVRFKRH